MKNQRMHYIVVFTLLTASISSIDSRPFFSYSPSVGYGTGSVYTLKGNGRITAIRVYEYNQGYIAGFQLRFGPIWSVVAGFSYHHLQELELWDDEAIIQISGKFARYVQSVCFVTSKGRSLCAGQPAGRSFNLYSAHCEAGLIIISGRVNGAITSIAAHWDAPYESNTNLT